MLQSNVSVRRRHRGGVVVVWTVITIAALIGFAGLATDTSYVLLTGHQLQNAADAAALAAASNIQSGTSVAASNAVSVAAANVAAGSPVQISSASDVVFGNYSRTTAAFTAGATPTNAVQVTCRRTSGSPGGPLALMFGPIVGISSSNVSRQSVAMTDSLSAGLIVLEPTASSALTLSSNVNVTNGSILVNSTSSTAVGWSGHPSISCDSMHICGNAPGVVTSGIYTGNCHLNCSPCSDPCAGLTPCSKGTTQSSPKSPLQPGYYPNGLPAGTCLPGNYYVDNGCSIGNGQTLDCTAGCHIYLHTGGFNCTGTGSFSCNPPSSGTYKDVCIYQDRGNTTPCTFHQGGSSTPSCTGTIYCPSSHVTCTAGTHNCSANQIVCKTFDCQGECDITNTGAFSTAQHQAFLCK